MTQSRRQSPSDDETPGADRFWGQFSQTGRDREDDPMPDPDAGPDRATGQDGSADRATTEDGPEPTGAGDHTGGHGECLEWCPICRSAELIRNAVTPELREQAESLQREAFSVFQAFLNSYAEKTGGTSQKNQETSDQANSEPDPGNGEDQGITEIPLD